MPSLAEVEELRDEYMADDVELEEEMTTWSEAELRVYFERMLRPPSAEEWKRWVPDWKAPSAPPAVRLVCFHNSGSSASMFTALRDKINPLTSAEGVEMMAIELPGRMKRIKESFFTRLRPLSEALCTLLAPVLCQPIPYVLVGHSVGTWVAYETWQRLREAGVPPPAYLAVSCFSPPHLPTEEWPWRRSTGDVDAELAMPLDVWKAAAREWGTPEAVLSQEDVLHKIVRPQVRRRRPRAHGLARTASRARARAHGPPIRPPCWPIHPPCWPIHPRALR